MEVYVLKVRIKFSKTGSLKFIGHLDVMRYFQKAFRRSKVDIAYSKGYSPHQLLSFAAPLGIGLTSEGEYLDAEFYSIDTSENMIKLLNDVMVDDIQILDFTLLDDNAKNAMSCVAAADYWVGFRENYYDNSLFINSLTNFYSQDAVNIIKQTKKSEQLIDIKPLIYDLHLDCDKIFMKLATGSVNNLKPSLVMEAMCNFLNIEYNKLAFTVHRIETYFMSEDDNISSLTPLSQADKKVLEPMVDNVNDSVTENEGI